MKILQCSSKNSTLRFECCVFVGFGVFLRVVGFFFVFVVLGFFAWDLFVGFCLFVLLL